MGFFRQYIAPLFIVLIFAIALLATSISISNPFTCTRHLGFTRQIVSSAAAVSTPVFPTNVFWLITKTIGTDVT